MQTTTCKRCDGLGMEQHKSIAGGVCFTCGRLPGGGKASERVLCSARERIILDLAALIRVATAEKANGTLRGWLEDLNEIDPRVNVNTNPIPRLLTVAPTDVATRARAAFAKIGVPV